MTPEEREKRRNRLKQEAIRSIAQEGFIDVKLHLPESVITALYYASVGCSINETIERILIERLE
jgi:RNA:NAD 2'-phosphotransferase (TPT1/KptA family)